MRLVSHLAPELGINGRLAVQSDPKISTFAQALKSWQAPSGLEGPSTPEVTMGVIEIAALSSKTIMAKSFSGLYFIGEVVDMTG